LTDTNLDILAGSSRLGEFLLQSGEALDGCEGQLITIGASDPRGTYVKLRDDWTARVRSLSKNKYTVFISSIQAEHTETAYAKMKLLEEAYITQNFSNSLILRCENIVGLPSKIQKFDILNEAIANGCSKLDANIAKQFLTADMFLSVLRCLLLLRPEGIMNVASSTPITPRDLVHVLGVCASQNCHLEDQTKIRIETNIARLLEFVTAADLKIGAR